MNSAYHTLPMPLLPLLLISVGTYSTASSAHALEILRLYTGVDIGSKTMARPLARSIASLVMFSISSLCHINATPRYGPLLSGNDTT